MRSINPRPTVNEALHGVDPKQLPETEASSGL